MLEDMHKTSGYPIVEIPLAGLRASLFCRRCHFQLQMLFSVADVRVSVANILLFSADICLLQLLLSCTGVVHYWVPELLKIPIVARGEDDKSRDQAHRS